MVGKLYGCDSTLVAIWKIGYEEIFIPTTQSTVGHFPKNVRKMNFF